METGVKVILMGAAFLLSGCGAQWFPPADQAATAAVTSTDVGGYLRSLRTGPAAYTVLTAKGIFSTYTSLGVPYGSAAVLEKYVDSRTGMLVGKVLRASGASILVKDVLELN